MLDYAGPAEAMRMAADGSAPFELHHCGPLPSVATSLGTRIDGIDPLPLTLPPNTLVVVVGSTDSPEPGTSAPYDAVARWLRTTPADDTRIASICSGGILLARAGFLAGRCCTTHFGLVAELERVAPSARVQSDFLFVDDGSILTSAGITAGIDLALYLIEHYAGVELATDIARRQVVRSSIGAARGMTHNFRRCLCIATIHIPRYTAHRMPFPTIQCAIGVWPSLRMPPM
ncbi:DJ-1/PfpI family protein [Robbsia sp. Bb-Pol-6]|uniref:DJ-1/PfpI family protein n=1 Tax=Robbsia betulipollinis TaxID=2981849 RepID=A0ABT3ZPG7_9BURK|nr:DJ-1/PfpI family protein [Robbsia betulipollinis]MCY0388449.1 DJ-1/PfpI family protein [Robbsia betulipollinis]